VIEKERKMGFDQRVSRKVTSQLLDLAEEGVIDWESLARDALGWMSEDEVAEFARRNDYIRDEEDEDE
jgi:aldehyde:ferredoxin oxidoreductase